MSRDTGKMALGVAVADDPTGPYVDRGSPILAESPIGAIDSTFFHDPIDGKNYMIWKHENNSLPPDGHAALHPGADRGRPLADPRHQARAPAQRSPGNATSSKGPGWSSAGDTTTSSTAPTRTATTARHRRRAVPRARRSTRPAAREVRSAPPREARRSHPGQRARGLLARPGPRLGRRGTGRRGLLPLPRLGEEPRRRPRQPPRGDARSHHVARRVAFRQRRKAVARRLRREVKGPPPRADRHPRSAPPNAALNGAARTLGRSSLRPRWSARSPPRRARGRSAPRCRARAPTPRLACASPDRSGRARTAAG